MMITVAAVAAALAIYKSSNIIVTIMVMWIPFGMIAERFLVDPPRTEDRPSIRRMCLNYGVMSLCASLAALADWIGCSAGTPEILSPLPLFGAMPRMIVSSEWPNGIESINWVFEIIPSS